MTNGKFLAEDNSVPAGQEIVTELLNRCLKWAEIVLTRFDSLSLNRCYPLDSFLLLGKAK